jgi:hypothetical protein
VSAPLPGLRDANLQPGSGGQVTSTCGRPNIGEDRAEACGPVLQVTVPARLAGVAGAEVGVALV